MTTLIFTWRDWSATAGLVSIVPLGYTQDGPALVVPRPRVIPVTGTAAVDVTPYAGHVVELRWTPQGVAEPYVQTVIVPAGGEAHALDLDRVDPGTLEPLPEGMPSAVDLVARAEALVARIESGEFTGADGADGRGITSVEMVGASARFTWTDGTTQDVDLSVLAGDDGDDGVGVESVTLEGTTLRFSLSDGSTRDVDAAALRGEDGRTPVLAWDGTRLVVDGVPGPSLKGEAGDDGHTPVPTWQGTALSWDGGEAVDLRGADGKTPTIKIGTVTSGTTPSATIKGTSPDLTLDLVLKQGEQGIQGPPGVVSSASSYVIVGPGRPDRPATTNGAITGAEPVGAEYRSEDSANVGAYRWVKRPGGRWEVTDGDTGWRNVKADALTSPSQLGIRRMGALVMVAGEHQSAPSTETSVYVPSSGFTPSSGTSRFVSGVSGNGGRVIIGGQDGSIRVAGGGTWARFSITTFTTDPWPISLPGTPA